jgi:hypothetical protein
MLRKVLLSMVLLLALTMGLYGCTTNTNNPSPASYKVANAYVTLDINPSVEIMTDDSGLVSDVNALNTDADVLLVDADLEGKTIEEVIDELVDTATDLGYITETDDNAVVVTAEAEDENETVELETKLEAKIKKHAEEKAMRMEVIKARDDANAEFKTLAQTLNVSVGKLKLIRKAQEFDETLTDEAGAGMPVKELNRIIHGARDEVKELVSQEWRDDYFTQRDENKALYFLSNAELLHNALMAATDDAFASVLTDGVTVDQIKTLYQAYWDELNAYTALEDPATTDPVTPDAPVDNAEETDPAATDPVKPDAPVENPEGTEPETPVDPATDDSLNSEEPTYTDPTETDHHDHDDAEDMDPADTETVEEDETDEETPIVDAEIQALLDQKKALEQVIKDLMGSFHLSDGSANYEEIRTQLQAKFAEMKQLQELIEDKMEALEENADDDVDVIIDDEDDDDDTEVIVKTDALEYYHQVREKYEDEFEKIGVELEDLEDLFKTDIQAELDVLNQNLHDNLQSLIDGYKVQVETREEEQRQSKEDLKEIWKQRGGR